MNKLNILHIVPTYIPAYRYGGSLFAVRDLCRGLSKHANITICTTSVNGKNNSDVIHNSYIDDNGTKIIYFKSNVLRRLYFSFSLARYLSKNISKYNVVHLHYSYLFPANYAARICQRNNVPYVITPHGMLDYKLISSKNFFVKSLWIKCFENKTLSNATYIHVTSDKEHSDLLNNPLIEKKIKLKPAFVIPNGVVLKADSNIKINQKNHKQILYLGRVSWKKNIEAIIKAMTYLPEQYQLNIVGGCEENYCLKLKTLAKKLSLDHRVHFFGAKYGHHKDEFYKKSGLLVLSSLSENFALVVLEALTFGSAVLISKQVGASEIIKNHQVGYITDGSEEDIANKVLNYFNHHYNQSILDKTQSVAKHYSWDKLAHQYHRMYQDAINVTKLDRD